MTETVTDSVTNKTYAYESQMRQQSENTAFRQATFEGKMALIRQKTRISFADRPALTALDRQIAEYRLIESLGWVGMYERHAREIEQSSGSGQSFSSDHVEAIARGLAYQRSLVATLERELGASG